MIHAASMYEDEHKTLAEIALLNERGEDAVAEGHADKLRAREFIRRGWAVGTSIPEGIRLTAFGRWVLDQPYIMGDIAVRGWTTDGYGGARLEGLAERLYGWSDGIVTWKSIREISVPDLEA